MSAFCAQTQEPLHFAVRDGKVSGDAAVVYFLSDGSKFTTGQVLSVDGGWDVSEGQYPE